MAKVTEIDIDMNGFMIFTEYALQESNKYNV